MMPLNVTGLEGLICLGDLSRYCVTFGEQNEPDKESKFAEAAQYYRQASMLMHDNGTPHNQLAVLECARTPLNTVNVLYHYCVSLGSTTPGASSAVNVQAFFKRYRARGFPIPTEHPVCLRADSAKVYQARIMTGNQFCAGFFALHDLMWSNARREDVLGPVSFETASAALFGHFDRVLTATWLGSDHGITADITKNGMLSSVQLMKLIVINCWSVARLQHQQPGDASSTSNFDGALFIALRMLSQLIVWLVQTVNHDHGRIKHNDYFAPVRIALQWLHDPQILQCVAETSQSAGSKRRKKWLWSALAFFLNSRPHGSLAEQQQPSLEVSAKPEDFEFRGFTVLDAGRKDLNFGSLSAANDRAEQAYTLARTIASHPKSELKVNGSGAHLQYVDIAALDAGEAVAIDESMLLPQWVETSHGVQDSNTGSGGGSSSGSSGGSTTQVANLKEAAVDSARVLPRFLIMDTKTVVRNLRLVQELLQAKKFVIVMPLAVISRLEELKKGNGRESTVAREAAKWVEHALKQDETRLRAQVRDETVDLPFEPSADTPLESARILSCCVHFCFHEAGQGIAMLLTGDSKLATLARDAKVPAAKIEKFAKIARGLR